MFEKGKVVYHIWEKAIKEKVHSDEFDNLMQHKEFSFRDISPMISSEPKELTYDI